MVVKITTVYSVETEKKARSTLKGLTKKPKPKGLTLQELIQVLKTDINAARDAGYTLAEIASTLSASGVEIKENTLKQYLREAK